VQLENVFRRIHPNLANLVHGQCPLSEIIHTTSFWHIDAVVAVHTNSSAACHPADCSYNSTGSALTAQELRTSEALRNQTQAPAVPVGLCYDRALASPWSLPPYRSRPTERVLLVAAVLNLFETPT
jgi:hypothetical protein